MSCACSTSVLGLFLFTAAVPTPLHGEYAARWHFSRISLSAVFVQYGPSPLRLVYWVVLAAAVPVSRKSAPRPTN